MKITDFSRSFLTFRLDLRKHRPVTLTHEPIVSLNNARIQIECRCLVVHKQNQERQEFVLGASCKTERVGVDRDIWVQPNADFVPVFSSRQFLQIKTYDRVGQTMKLFPPTLGDQKDRHSGEVTSAFDNLRIDLEYAEGELIDTPERIVESTLNNEPMAARTRLETDRYLVELEYPIKTMNASERELVYQTDTGPVLLPDLSRDWNDLIDGLELAYSAFNDSAWIEFIVRAPVEIAPGVSVHHYCRSQRFEARNEVVRVIGGGNSRYDGAVSESVAQLRPHVGASRRTVSS